MTKREVIGYLAGHFDPQARRIDIRAAYPGRSISNDANSFQEAEMDPVFEVGGWVFAWWVRVDELIFRRSADLSCFRPSVWLRACVRACVRVCVRVCVRDGVRSVTRGTAGCRNRSSRAALD